MDDGDVVCPFCKEGGFDLVGLKRHLEGDYQFSSEGCSAYEDLEESLPFGGHCDED